MAEDAVAAKRRRRGGGGDLSALPEHLLQEVLSRVGTVKDLFMLAATCRRWLGRFTDRTFLREILCPGQGLLGFFLQDALPGVMMWTLMDAAQRASACSFLPAPRSFGPGPTARALTSSLVADGGGAFDYAVPLAARRGIVLMQRVARRRDTHLLFGVCNPVTGERHLLAPLDRDPNHVHICSYAIITAADAGADAAGRFTFSQLLVATMAFKWMLCLHLYSAATRSWSAPTPALCQVNSHRFSRVGQRSAVVHQGAAHWLWLCDTGAQDDDGSLYKLSVQLGGGGAAAAGPICFTFTRIPVRAGGDPHLCVTGDGKLAVVCVYISHVAVSTCRQQQQAGGGQAAAEAEAWERTAFTIPAVVPYPETPPLWQPMEKWFDLSGGSMLVLYRSSAVFVVDLHNKTMEKVMDCFPPLSADKMNRTVVPYEMDLIDFIMLKLGGLISSAGSSG
ncbi:hypothetical protein PVAP13_4KG321200 [Panicum virgatum]|uniref:F-box domain-containing protein n=1 Tax=Panicum virgatum TaxID=38727 RepID=A0A8T0TU66_PANVG|nr:hypothetical protein PVAP13_4KG321200 [Panicum virgatum]